MLQLTDVMVRYPARQRAVLREVTVQLAAGERAILFGPSGAGKSTVLQTIAAIVPHSVNARLDGEVRVDGISTRQNSVLELSRRVGLLGQDPAASVCLPRVDDEIALVLENRAVPPEQISGLIDDALALADASALREKNTATLSGGQTQRVALAATMAARPEVLLLDEPTSMLDARGLDAVRAALRVALERHNPTVLLVEHRLDEFAGEQGIDGLPGRAIVLDETGSVVADGTTRDVLRGTAAMLHELGCWLPLEAELDALTGSTGALRSEKNQRFLAGLVPPPPTEPTLGETVLEASALAVGYGGRAVLSGVSFAVRAGEIVALLGENGGGKSTLLHTLAGLARPVAGTVTGPRPGLIFQNPEHQFVAHTVAAEIAHGLSDDVEAIVARQLVRHRLDHLREQHPHRLSGGEKRRLSLAAMLAHDRAVLLADEPTFGLDRRDALSTAAALRDAAGGVSATGTRARAVVFASHDLRLVASLAHRVVVIADGRILADGDMLDVLSHEDILAAAGLRLPAIVRWLIDRCVTGGQLRGALAACAATPVVVPR